MEAQLKIRREAEEMQAAIKDLMAWEEQQRQKLEGRTAGERWCLRTVPTSSLGRCGWPALITLARFVNPFHWQTTNTSTTAILCDIHGTGLEFKNLFLETEG